MKTVQWKCRVLSVDTVPVMISATLLQLSVFETISHLLMYISISNQEYKTSDFLNISHTVRELLNGI